MNEKLDDIKTILNNIKNDLEVIKYIVNKGHEINVDTSSYNYFNNLFSNVNELKKYNNFDFDNNNQKEKVSFSILIMHLEQLLPFNQKQLLISKNELNLVDLCISDISNFYNSLDNYYKDDTKEKFFYNINEIYKSLNEIYSDDFLKDDKLTENIINKYIKILSDYKEVYQKIPTSTQLELSRSKYKQLDIDIYLSINNLESLLNEILSEIINSNDKLPYGINGLLPGNIKHYFFSLLKSGKYQEVLNIKMLDKNIEDDLIRKRLLNNYISSVSSIKKISNYYKNNQIIIDDSTLSNDSYFSKIYDFDMFDDSNYEISDDDKKSLDYIIKYQNLNKKMRKSRIKRKELKNLKLLAQKMKIIEGKVKRIIKDLIIVGRVNKPAKIVRDNKYLNRKIDENIKKK